MPVRLTTLIIAAVIAICMWLLGEEERADNLIEFICDFGNKEKGA